MQSLTWALLVKLQRLLASVFLGSVGPLAHSPLHA